MKDLIRKAICLLLFGAVAGFDCATAQSVERWATSAAGPEFSSANLRVSSTIGEPLTATLNASATVLTQGIQQSTILITAIKTDVEPVVSIYPVPTSETLVISSELSLTGSYRITAMNGELALKGLLNGLQTQVNVQALASGSYTLYLMPRQGNPSSYKITKL